MGSVIIRNLDDAAIERLKARAAGRGVSLEHLLREGAMEMSRQTPDDLRAEVRALRARARPSPVPVAEDVRAWRDGDGDDGRGGGRAAP